jgi:NAD(P)-dependent dehydrogenase (short-subunit alcohol dehydrogenase family)
MWGRLQMASVEDNTSGGHYSYRASKAALNIVNTSLSADLAGHNVVCTLLHPG